jgi:hypothetical protein
MARRFRPDLVLVYGRFRMSCIMAAPRLGGPGIKIAVHDWDCPHHHCVLPFARRIDGADNLGVLEAGLAARSLRACCIELRRRYNWR